MAKKETKNKEVVQAIRYTWDSLSSHLPYVDGKDKAFEIRTIQEYAYILKVLTKNLK